jgi:hypothetical protein
VFGGNVFEDKEIYLIFFMIAIIIVSLFTQINWKKSEECLTIKCTIEKYLDKSEKLDECRSKNQNCEIEIHEYKTSMWKMDKELTLDK